MSDEFIVDPFRCLELLSRFLFFSAACGASLQAEDIAVLAWMLLQVKTHIKETQGEN